MVVQQQEQQKPKKTYLLFVSEGEQDNEPVKFIMKSENIFGALSMLTGMQQSCEQWKRLDISIEEIEVIE